MASIQQSFNQILMSAQIGAGLYAHSPAGKEAAELRKLKRDMPKIEKQIELTGENVSAEPSESDKHFTEAFKAGKEQSKRLFELRPTEKNLKEYKEMSETLEEWEKTLMESQEKRQKTLANQKKENKMRRSIILDQYEKNMEVEENGK